MAAGLKKAPLVRGGVGACLCAAGTGFLSFALVLDSVWPVLRVQCGQLFASVCVGFVVALATCAELLALRLTKQGRWRAPYVAVVFWAALLLGLWAVPIQCAYFMGLWSSGSPVQAYMNAAASVTLETATALSVLALTTPFPVTLGARIAGLPASRQAKLSLLVCGAAVLLVDDAVYRRVSDQMSSESRLAGGALHTLDLLKCGCLVGLFVPAGFWISDKLEGNLKEAQPTNVPTP